MTKFKVGDKVRCIAPPEGVKHEGTGGAGWKRDGVFVIGKITTGGICWPRDNADGFGPGRGVYSDCLELADEPNEQVNNGLIKWKAGTA